MSFEVLDTLTAARELLSDRKRWHQGHYARTSDGLEVSADDEHAVAWCAAGALEKVNTNYDDYALLQRIAHRYYGKNIVAVNDGTDADEAYRWVLDVYDRAILAKRAAKEQW